MKNEFYNHINSLQSRIISAIEAIDGKGTFKRDSWQRPQGGGGLTCVLENGAVFEKAGVNVSAVFGQMPEFLKQETTSAKSFYACGLSLVLHPLSPMVPTVHANWRYFEMYDAQNNIIDAWFGGGQDLTPYYLFEEDAVHFHRVCKSVSQAHHPEFYNRFKKACDSYFWNEHRNEARGIGGLFFDHLRENSEVSLSSWKNFVVDSGNAFIESYLPIVEKRKSMQYNQEHKNWQEIRRGRYVEFNLLHDKGTLFGLKTNGRIESILMSLPPKVSWVYEHQPKKDSQEQKLIEVLKHPIDWIK